MNEKFHLNFAALVILWNLTASVTMADIKLEGRMITAFPDRQEGVIGQNIELLSTIDCHAKTVSNRSIELQEPCAYLHGLYRYIFIPKGETKKRQVLADFAVTRTGAKNYTLLINDQIEIDESTTTSEN